MSNQSSGFSCPSCRTDNQVGARFCLNCGASLAEQHSPYQPPSSHQAPPMVSGFIYAGFWKRFIAYIVDVIIIYIIIGVLAAVLFGSFFGDTNNSQSMINNPAALFSSAALIYFGVYLLWWLYYAIQESSSAQATLGKRLLGIKVTDIQGNQLTFGHAAGRQLAGVVSQFTMLIGYLMAAFTGRKQALHDMIASTVVVNKHFGPQQIYTVNQSPPPGMSIGGIIAIVCLILIIPIGGILAAIAIPAYQDYTIRAQVNDAYFTASESKPAIIEYASETGYWPANFEQANLSSANMQTESYYIQLEKNGVLAINFTKPQVISSSSIRLTPELTNTGEYQWHCDGSAMKAAYLPKACRSN
ncbi:RDD family protein [Aliikangiella sp. IMCC44359]|uniref:RDD family protein n=1 Tax=Aliikangiella sp. IMCC44359 TaxID=3459125 RepID=UPI00403B3576